MSQTFLGSLRLLFLGLLLALCNSQAAKAGAVTLALKVWSASLSLDGPEGKTGAFPGVSFSWSVNDRLWVSGSYLAGEADFTTPLMSRGTLEEADSDIVVGWSFRWLDAGIGYRLSEFTTLLNGGSFRTTSSGPMVFLGGGNLFGLSRWGYYWGLTSMFEDLDDSDGKQEHFNGEAGLRWLSRKDFSILLGYRHKEYTGRGASGLSFGGPVISFAYTFR